MNTLIIDTSIRATLCVAIRGETVEVVDASTLAEQTSTSAAIIPLIDRALSALGLRPAELDCIAAVVGPGSFTGLRIGVSVANAMATLGIQTLPVNVLEMLAFSEPEGTLTAVPSRVGFSYTSRGELTVDEVAAAPLSVGVEGSGAVTVLSRAQYVQRLVAYVTAHAAEADGEPLAPLYLKKSQAERLRETKHG